jgi:hypothetical protein
MLQLYHSGQFLLMKEAEYQEKPTELSIFYYKEELSDTKGINRIRKLKKHRQLNDQRNNMFNLTICHFRCL